MARKFFVGGNFKMNGTISGIKDIVQRLNEAKLDSNTEVVISPPSLYLLLTREHLRKEIEVAAQNCFDKPNGAYTGEISATQLFDSGIGWTLTGHSERRTILCEKDEFVANKTKAALDGGLGVILCIGETLEQREANETIKVVTHQLNAVADKTKDFSKIVIAYEPVWAIGTGKTASTEQGQEVHAEIRSWLRKTISSEAAEKTRVIYGGSVSEKNCRDLAKQEDIDGFLVGGASLKPACKFLSSACPK
ncbi:triosephosphate isomerase [Thelotrema lepadinum]|nr:triosephosphate isomerase [Thelotrema lepadinum]